MATVEQLFAETYRLSILRRLETLLGTWGYLLVAGVDEAGRGCLAGPVVAAAVIPDPSRCLPGVDDSKRLTAAQREKLERAIRDSALAHAVVAVAPSVIDRINILEATRHAMRQALTRLRPLPDCAIIDAVPLRGAPCPCLPLVKGDSRSYAVAAASILAKTARDRMMVDLDARYPQYGFAEHKGYGAPYHRQALQDYGPCPAHRLTFKSVLPRGEV